MRASLGGCGMSIRRSCGLGGERRIEMKAAIRMLLILLVLIPASSAFSQDAVESAALATVTATAPVTQADQAGLQKSWGEKRLIRTLQRRLFAKFGRMEFTFFTGIVPNDPFVFYTPVGLRFDYHFNEAFAIELSGAFLGCVGSDVGDGQERGFEQGCLRFASDLRNDLAVDKVERTQVRSIQLLDQQVTRVDLLAMWSPIFGKVAAMNDNLVHFDVNFVGGAGFLLTESISTEDLQPEYRPTFEGAVGGGMKFYFGTRYGIRADFRQYVYLKQKDDDGSGGGTANPSEISIGFSVFTD